MSGTPHRCSKEVTEKERETEVLALLAQGNHKSAHQDEPKTVKQLLAKHVLVHGFSMVVSTAELVPLIPDAMVQPFGLTKQWTLDEQGSRKIKHRITQDLSHSETSKELPLSTNSWIDANQHPSMVCDWDLPAPIIHFTPAGAASGSQSGPPWQHGVQEA